MKLKNSKKEQQVKIKRGDIVSLKRNTIYESLGSHIQDINRLYLVVSNNVNNARSPIVALVSLSRQIQKANYPMHALINKDKYENLEYDNVILAEQLKIVDKKYIKTKIASLDEEDMAALNRCIYIQYIDEKLRNKETI